MLILIIFTLIITDDIWGISGLIKDTIKINFIYFFLLFKCSHRKLKMTYMAYMYALCYISILQCWSSQCLNNEDFCFLLLGKEVFNHLAIKTW